MTASKRHTTRGVISISPVPRDVLPWKPARRPVLEQAPAAPRLAGRRVLWDRLLCRQGRPAPPSRLPLGPPGGRDGEVRRRGLPGGPPHAGLDRGGLRPTQDRHDGLRGCPLDLRARRAPPVTWGIVARLHRRLRPAIRPLPPALGRRPGEPLRVQVDTTPASRARADAR